MKIHSNDAALEWAAEEGHLKVVKELLKHKAPISALALEYAATRGHLEVVKELIKHRAYLTSWGLKFGAAIEIRNLLEDYTNVKELN